MKVRYKENYKRIRVNETGSPIPLNCHLFQRNALHIFGSIFLSAGSIYTSPKRMKQTQTWSDTQIYSNVIQIIGELYRVCYVKYNKSPSKLLVLQEQLGYDYVKITYSTLFAVTQYNWWLTLAAIPLLWVPVTFTNILRVKECFQWTNHMSATS